MKKKLSIFALLVTMVASAMAQTNTNGPIVTFTNVQKDGTTTFTLYINENNELAISNSSAAELGDAAKFRAIQKDNGKWAFYNESKRLYMIWRGKGNGYNSDKGVLAEYNATYCDWTMNASANLSGGYYFVGKRSNGTSDGSLVILKAGTFDAYGNSEGWADGHTNVYKIESEEYTATLTDNQGTAITCTTTGFPVPSYSGATLSNPVWADGKLAATVGAQFPALPFPLSSAEVTNPTFISSFKTGGGNAIGRFKWYAPDADDVKVKRDAAILRADLDKFSWAIYASLENGAFAYSIKNIAKDKYIYSEASYAANNGSHGDNVVILSATPTKFKLTTDGENRFYYVVNNVNQYLSSNSTGDADAQLGVYAKTHNGTTNSFHTPAYDLSSKDELVSGGIYAFVTSRGWVGANDGDVAIATVKTSVTPAASTENAMFQWALYQSKNGNYYLYNLGKQKFLGVPSQDMASIPLADEPMGKNLTFKDIAGATSYPIMFSPNNTHAVSQNANAGLFGWAGGWNRTDDAGSNHNVTYVGSLTADQLKTIADLVEAYDIYKQDLYNTSNGSLEIPPYRIPGITVDPETGRIITTAARLVCGTDPGYGQVDVVCRISDDNGENWSEMKDVAVGTGITSPTENYFDTAFGDPAVVADRTSNEVLIIVVAGCTKYQTATRQIPNEIGTIHSLDNGNTWGEPVRVTEQIYSLFDAENGGNTIQSAFVGGGKIFQSRIVKVGQYYRLYAAMCARPNGNRVIYSDDFGRTWKALGGAAALPAPGGDEPKCEELPDGRVVLSSRVGGGRIYNIYTYSNTTTAEGEWGTSVKSTFAGSGKTPGGNSTNGEILIVPVQRNSDGKEMYLALQSLPTGGGRSNVGIFYKELTDVEDINTVDNFATGWNGYFEVTTDESAYSSMDLQNDGRIGFIYEENYTKHGEVSNPHSVPFPDANNLGTHNYDGYDNIYVAYPLEYITNRAYSIKRSVDRRTYLQTYFTALTADAVEEVKAAVATNLEGLSTEPTIAEVDGIYFNIGKGDVITAANANAGKVGYYLDAAVATYKEKVMAATTREQLAAAETELIATEWIKPVSGKAYTFKSVQKGGAVRWYKYNATENRIDLTATESEATPFVCRLLENGKYVFVCNDGKYMTWRASASNHTTSGVSDAYDMTNNKYYTDINIAKMTTASNIVGNLSNTRYVSISASRDDRNETGFVVVKNNGGSPVFDGASAAFYNDNYSSAFIMEEAAFGNAPKVNNVGESTLMSEDLHGKHMSTFSATYPTVAPQGVTAYYATKDGENVVLNAVAEGKAIPANTGVILVSEEGGNAVMLPKTTETDADVTGNLLVGTAGAAKDMTGIANAYLLAGGNQGAGFYRCSGGTLAAGKAYLQLESAQQAVRVRTRSVGGQGGTTEIEMTIANGQQPTTVYDLQGRRVLNPTKGMYIVNGKKVIF